MSTEETPRRMNAGTLALYQHEERMAQAARPIATTATAELTRNAKGETQIAVKATGATIQEAEAEAVASYDRLRAKYPSGSE